MAKPTPIGLHGADLDAALAAIPSASTRDFVAVLADHPRTPSSRFQADQNLSQLARIANQYLYSQGLFVGCEQSAAGFEPAEASPDALRALSMRDGGSSWSEIAEVLGVSDATAKRWVQQLRTTPIQIRREYTWSIFRLPDGGVVR